MSTTLITGANTGMGLATAEALLAAGHDLVLCVRSPTHMAALAGRLGARHPDRKLAVVGLDLASLASVRRCAGEVLSGSLQPDVLLFNAGIMTPPWSHTADGFESQFQVNYLGHFLLFQLLHGQMPRGAIRKVISVSSLSGEMGRNDSVEAFAADARRSAQDYDALECYRESKLAQVMFTLSLHDRHGSDGLFSAAIHPGLVNTQLFYRKVGPAVRALFQPLAWLGYLTGKLATPRRGADTAIWLASHAVAPGGAYWQDRRIRAHNPLADRRELRDALWDWTLSELEPA